MVEYEIWAGVVDPCTIVQCFEAKNAKEAMNKFNKFIKSDRYYHRYVLRRTFKYVYRVRAV